jgi:hypothetical protein
MSVWEGTEGVASSTEPIYMTEQDGNVYVVVNFN